MVNHQLLDRRPPRLQLQPQFLYRRKHARTSAAARVRCFCGPSIGRGGRPSHSGPSGCHQVRHGEVKRYFIVPRQPGLIHNRPTAPAAHLHYLGQHVGESSHSHSLTVDMRGLRIMADAGWPVVFDATHSVQLPSGAGGLHYPVRPCYAIPSGTDA